MDDIPANRQLCNTTFDKILEARLTKRALLKNTAVAAFAFPISSTLNTASSDDKYSSLSFQEIPHGMDERLHLAKEYTVQVILRWGDPLSPEADVFQPQQQSSSSQLHQFGYNNDFVVFLPIAQDGENSTHGLLVVNHEYVNSTMMHPDSPHAFNLNRAQVETEMAAHGLSIVEIQKQTHHWKINLDSKYNRRITPMNTAIFSGPVRGHQRVKTEFSPKGKTSLGTFANCAGAVTPWGTVLTAEENVQTYFMGQVKKTKEFENYKRFGLFGDKTARSIWGKYHDHWQINRHPQAALHAGWIVEIDPFDSNFVPIKRTALGRCKHEGCGVYVNKDGRVIVYMGDDQVFEYVYRFVSKQKYQPGNRKHNLSLLDEGELAVAEFTDQGRVIWHSLEWNKEPHTKANGFESQADVVLDLRKAADVVGATPMDRPEEIKVNPVSGNVFAVFTNNIQRKPFATNAANPRALNRDGHILELIPPEQDHSASEYQWEVFILAGNPKSKLDRAYYNSNVSVNGWLSAPDNCSFDKNGNIWITTDGFNRRGNADGIYVSATSGIDKALPKQFLRAPIGAEICSPCFTPDCKTMFCSIQHPGGGSSYDQPSTRWPDFEKNIPPRPSVVAITHDRNEKIGS